MLFRAVAKVRVDVLDQGDADTEVQGVESVLVGGAFFDISFVVLATMEDVVALRPALPWRGPVLLVT